MNHKEPSLPQQYDPYYHQTFANYDSQEEYYKKMAEIKDKNIQDLLNELKETKEIYQEYKNQYLMEEKRLKTKFTEMSNKFEAQVGELEKYRIVNSKMKAELQAGGQRERRLMETHENHVKQLRGSLLQIESKVKEMAQQKASLTEKYESLQEKYARVEDRLRKREGEAQIYEQQTKQLREEMLRKENQWEQERRKLNERIKEGERKKVAQTRANNKLDDLQIRIKNTLMKM